MIAVLKNSNHGASLFHHNLGLSCLAPKTKHQKQTLKHAEENYTNFGSFSIWVSFSTLWEKKQIKTEIKGLLSPVTFT